MKLFFVAKRMLKTKDGGATVAGQRLKRQTINPCTLDNISEVSLGKIKKMPGKLELMSI